MPEQTGNAMQCNEFDALVMDAIDGVLKGEKLDRFQAHARVCKACGPLLAEVEAGRRWLKDLTEVEPPAGLVENILASTTGIVSDRLRTLAPSVQPRTTWLERAQAWFSGTMQPIWVTVRQPRFAMSFGMAFFSLSVALSVAGVKPSDLSRVSLRPAAIRHTYYATQARIIRYVDNVKPVLELQAAVRRIKRNAEPAEPGRKETAPVEKRNDTTQQPEQRQERNYSQGEQQVILAGAPAGPSANDLPVVSVTTYRRFV